MSELRPFDESLPMALLKAREATMRLFRPLLAEHELTEQQWRVLRALGAHDQLEVGEIATATFLLGPSLSRILTNLEDRTLIERQPVDGDLRRSAISLTTTGQATVTAVAPRSEAIYAKIENSYGTERLGKLLSELTELASLDSTASTSSGTAATSKIREAS